MFRHPERRSSSESSESRYFLTTTGRQQKNPCFDGQSPLVWHINDNRWRNGKYRYSVCQSMMLYVWSWQIALTTFSTKSNMQLGCLLCTNMSRFIVLEEKKCPVEILLKPRRFKVVLIYRIIVVILRTADCGLRTAFWKRELSRGLWDIIHLLAMHCGLWRWWATAVFFFSFSNLFSIFFFKNNQNSK